MTVNGYLDGTAPQRYVELANELYREEHEEGE